jgi:hypothetical protein
MQEPISGVPSSRSKDRPDPMKQNDWERKQAMDSSIRRLIGSDANRSYLRALPAFRVETNLPSNLAALLERLERAEEQRSDQRRRD